LLALIVGPLLSSATSQVSVSVHIPFGNVSGANSSNANNLLVTRAQFAESWNASKRTGNWVAWRLRASETHGNHPYGNGPFQFITPGRLPEVTDLKEPIANPRSSYDCVER
jgi:DNA/RNA endonuclease G (NUC1)